MEKIPNQIEGLFEMNEKLLVLEEKGKEVGELVERMMSRLQLFQDFLKTTEAAAPEGPMKKNDMIDDLDKDIASYMNRRTKWDELMQSKNRAYQELGANEMLALKSNPEQLTATQTEALPVALFVFKNLIECHTIELMMEEKMIEDDEEFLDAIDKMLSDQLSQ